MSFQKCLGLAHSLKLADGEMGVKFTMHPRQAWKRTNAYIMEFGQPRITFTLWFKEHSFSKRSKLGEPKAQRAIMRKGLGEVL
jgi:hypothetical protein